MIKKTNFAAWLTVCVGSLVVLGSATGCGGGDDKGGTAPSTGGAPAGGTTGTGGAATGGTTDTGGAATGGTADTGGAATGGTADTGGAATGGTAETGGTETGGTTDTGGAADTGGAPAGGATDTGGTADTGGAATGGAGNVVGGAATAVCPPGTNPALACSPGVSPASPLITDFTPGSTWCAATGKWGTVENLVGGLFAYKGTVEGTTMKAQVDSSAMNLHLIGDVGVSDYAGGGLAFDACVNTATYTGVQFTLGGELAGCSLHFQVQTFSQQAIANRGGCGSDGGSCYGFPHIMPSTTSGTVVVLWSDLANTGLPADASALSAEIVGLQWQVQSGSSSACTGIDLTIDDIKFVQ